MREIPCGPAQGMLCWFHLETERLGINPLLMTCHCYTELVAAIRSLRWMSPVALARQGLEATWLRYASPVGADTQARRAFHFVAGAVHGPAGQVEQVLLRNPSLKCRHWQLRIIIARGCTFGEAIPSMRERLLRTIARAMTVIARAHPARMGWELRMTPIPDNV